MTLDAAARLADLPFAVLEVELSFLAPGLALPGAADPALARVPVTAANQDALRLLRLERDVLPDHLARALPEDQHPLVEACLRQLVDTGQPVEALLVLREPRDLEIDTSRDETPVLMRASPVSGCPRALLALVVLPAQQAEHQRFLDTVSHDLSEPLRMVTSFAELLQKHLGKAGFDQRAARYLHYMVDGAGRMQRMLGAVLDLARVHSRGSPLAPVDPGLALDRALGRLRPAMVDAGAHLTRGDLPRVLADEHQLSRVFQELIDNSLRFRKPDAPPRIHIGAESRGRECVLSVADNGIGMEARYLGDVFTLFRRLAPRDEHSGLGAGLAMVRAIVRRHGGRMWIESEVERGAAVFFTLTSVE